MVVGGDPIAAFDAAAIAAVHHHLLAVYPVGDANRRHHGPARTFPISRLAPIDMARRQAQRAMIAVLPSGYGRADERPAVTALERLGLVRAGPNPCPRSEMLCLILAPRATGRSMARRD